MLVFLAIIWTSVQAQGYNSVGNFPQAFTCIPLNIQAGTAPRPDDCNPQTIEQEIKAIRQRILPRFIAGDADGVLSMMAPDVYQVSSGAPTVKTVQQARAATEAVIPILKGGNIMLNRERYECFGDYAMELGPFAFYNAQGKLLSAGRELVMWKKINHVGDWKQFMAYVISDM